MTRAAQIVGMFCSVCGIKPRGCGGRLTRCLECLKADVDRERQQREAKAREAMAPVSAKKQARKRR
jgi:hypothetical protein